uniref:G/T mismatch-specific thymine DNA glycosylase n=1 Tax=Cyclopterus lumpus TaxID=8103 RepID=A0A8C3ANZ7_CYCLU
MAELSVHREPPVYQEPFYQNYNPPAQNHYQELTYQPHAREQQQPQPHPAHLHHPQHQHTIQQLEPSVRGRPPKQPVEDGKTQEEENEIEAAKKAKRALNRFNGMSVAEVMAKTLPDVITYNLDILIIGINPGLLSAFKGRHYPNPGNHFWKCLFLSGLTDEQLNFMHDQSLPEKYNIGFTNMVERTTPGSKDLSSKEIREGGRQLLDKLQKYRPLIAAFNGKGIYEIFCKETFGVKAKNLDFGLQPYKIPETETVPYSRRAPLPPTSSPARRIRYISTSNLTPFFICLCLCPAEDAKRMAIKEEQVDPEYESCGGLHGDATQSIFSAGGGGGGGGCVALRVIFAEVDIVGQSADNIASARRGGPLQLERSADQIPDISCTSSMMHQMRWRDAFEMTPREKRSRAVSHEASQRDAQQRIRAQNDGHIF